jgi:hypothetical protein
MLGQIPIGEDSPADKVWRMVFPRETFAGRLKIILKRIGVFVGSYLRTHLKFV